MKKTLLILVLATGSFVCTFSQEVGVRFGDVTGGNVAIDAVFSTGKFNRIHADVSFGHGLGIDVLWDMYVQRLGSEAFYWYIGAGPYTYIGNSFELGAAGELGLEYHFNDIPIAIGGDWRPYFRLIDNTDVGLNSFGFNVRWVF